MKGIIWYQENQEQALQELKEIEKYYDSKVIKRGFLLSRGQAGVTFENGDRWEISHARESARGKKCNVSYISTLIPQDVVDRIILPSTIALPYCA